MRLNFGTIVVVNGDYIGVVVKCWEIWKNEQWHYNYDVYVRSWNMIENYPEDKLDLFIYDKQLSDSEST